MISSRRWGEVEVLADHGSAELCDELLECSGFTAGIGPGDSRSRQTCLMGGPVDQLVSSGRVEVAPKIPGLVRREMNRVDFAPDVVGPGPSESYRGAGRCDPAVEILVAVRRVKAVA